MALPWHTPKLLRHIYASTFLAERNEAYNFLQLNTQTVGLVDVGSTPNPVAYRATAFSYWC